MPVHQSLLDINPDKVFEEHTIADIKEIHKKLHAEIERKRVEIRSMVGERYRDLIQAADTISDMKHNAKGVISHLETMSELCRQLQPVHLLGFRQDSETDKQERLAASCDYHSVVARVRLLVFLPEQIWSVLDQKDFLQAAQLYLLASSVANGLKLSIGTGLVSTKIFEWFPLVDHQWNIIRAFQPIVQAGCELRLKTLDLSDEEGCRCIAVLVLLGGCSLAQAQSRLLNLRTQALQGLMQGCQPVASIRSQVCGCLRLIVQTLSLLRVCGQEANGLLSVVSTLEEIVNPGTQSICSQLTFLDAHTLAYLPTSLQDFRPRLGHPLVPMSEGQLQSQQEAWLAEVQHLVGARLGDLLQYVSTVQGLQVIREAAHTAVASHQGVGDAPGVWEQIFRPLLTHRVRTLVSEKLQNLVGEVMSRLDEALKDLANSASVGGEQDVRWYVWNEEPGDLPTTGGWMIQSTRTVEQAGGLLMKTLGYSPCVQAMCRHLDVKLQALLEDLLVYTNHNNLHRHSLASFGENSSEHSFDKSMDRAELHDHLQLNTSQCVEEVISMVRQRANASQMEDNGSMHLMLLGRFLRAICDLCPHLQKCMSPDSSWNVSATKLVFVPSSGSTGNSPSWQQLRQRLEEESVRVLRTWGEAMARKLKASLPPLLLPLSPALLLHALPQWDLVKLDEEGVSSSVHVPSQPSLPLLSTLHAACQSLNMQAPHTLPRLVHQEVVESLVAQLLQQYLALSLEPLPQVLALQALFDVRFLAMLLILRDSKMLMDNSQATCEKLEIKIDPFDLDVLQPYLQANVKKSVHRAQNLLGCLVLPAKMAVLSGVRVGAGIEAPSPDDPTVLPLATSSPWFPLLPVATPALSSHVLLPLASRDSLAAHKVMDVPDRTKTKRTPNASQRPDASATNLMRSGAVAFFGEWFGS